MRKIIRFIDLILGTILVMLILFYKYFVSPVLGQRCRYLPTCSEYAIHSIKIHGFFKGSYLSLKRIISCHPFGHSGYDPVVKKKVD